MLTSEKTGVLRFSLPFARLATEHGLGRFATDEDVKIIEAAGGNTELPDHHVFLVIREAEIAHLGELQDFIKKVLSNMKVLAVSSEVKAQLIAAGWGYEPSQESIHSQFGEIDPSIKTEFGSIDPEMIPTLGDWEKLASAIKFPMPQAA